MKVGVHPEKDRFVFVLHPKGGVPIKSCLSFADKKTAKYYGMKTKEALRNA